MDNRYFELYTEGMLLTARIELEGMLAENKQRLIEGKSLAYTEDAFEELSKRHCLGHNGIITMLKGF